VYVRACARARVHAFDLEESSVGSLQLALFRFGLLLRTVVSQSPQDADQMRHPKTWLSPRARPARRARPPCAHRAGD
jgi:hypothetical protein